MDWILKALGAEVEQVEAVTSWSLRWQGGSRVVWAGVLLFALVLAIWWLYRRSPQDVRPGRRRLLAHLRMMIAALLVAMLLQPVLVLTLEREIARSLPVLVDTTGSMGMTDGGGASRLERVGERFESAAGREMIASLERELVVPISAFSSGEPVELGRNWKATEPQGDTTALGEVLEKTLERHGGASLAGIVLVTDGGQNGGAPLERAEGMLARAGVPIYPVAVGDPNARDVSVEAVEIREVVLANDSVPVTVRLRAQGMTSAGGKVVVTLDGVAVAEEEVEFDEDGAQDVRCLFIPERAGDYRLEARFEAAGVAESLGENNTARCTLRVVDRRLRVLLVDQAPRWEYKYLETMLLRERRVDLSCFLFEADRELAQVAGSPYIDQFPLRPEDLFAFDLVILGDIDPELLRKGHQDMLRRYVSEMGGALVVLAGKRFVPQRYQGTDLERLLPVEIAGTPIAASDAVASQPMRLDLTEIGRASVMLRLSDDAEASDALWRSLPPVYWAARVMRAKPAAEVLLSRPGGDGATGGIPVMARQRYGSGEVLFVGTDNFWRWRRNGGDRYHATLWAQVVQRMAGDRLLVENPRISLRSDRRSYRRGDRVRVHAQLRDAAWNPRVEEVVPGVLVSSADPNWRREIALRAVPGEPGRYRTEFSAGGAGNYRLGLAGDEVATLDFTVRGDDREFSRAGVNSDLLRNLAAKTGGAYLDLETLDRLPALITNRTARQTGVAEVPLWSSPLMFVVIIVLLTVEWVMRKYSELK